MGDETPEPSKWSRPDASELIDDHGNVELRESEIAVTSWRAPCHAAFHAGASGRVDARVNGSGLARLFRVPVFRRCDIRRRRFDLDTQTPAAPLLELAPPATAATEGTAIATTTATPASSVARGVNC